MKIKIFVAILIIIGFLASYSLFKEYKEMSTWAGNNMETIEKEDLEKFIAKQYPPEKPLKFKQSIELERRLNQIVEDFKKLNR